MGTCSLYFYFFVLVLLFHGDGFDGCLDLMRDSNFQVWLVLLLRFAFLLF